MTPLAPRADLDVEAFVRGPEGCVCGPLYTYAGATEPGQYDPDCPVHHDPRGCHCPPTSICAALKRRATVRKTAGGWVVHHVGGAVSWPFDSWEVAVSHADRVTAGFRSHWRAWQ